MFTKNVLHGICFFVRFNLRCCWIFIYLRFLCVWIVIHSAIVDTRLVEFQVNLSLSLSLALPPCRSLILISIPRMRYDEVARVNISIAHYSSPQSQNFSIHILVRFYTSSARVNNSSRMKRNRLSRLHYRRPGTPTESTPMRLESATGYSVDHSGCPRGSRKHSFKVYNHFSGEWNDGGLHLLGRKNLPELLFRDPSPV